MLPSFFFADDDISNNNINNRGSDFAAGPRPPPPAYAPPLPPSPSLVGPTTSIQLFIENQIQMLRISPATTGSSLKKVLPSVSVSDILDIFLEMKLNVNIRMREDAFGHTSICHHLSQMILETPAKPHNPFSLDNDNTTMDNIIDEIDITMHGGRRNVMGNGRPRQGKLTTSPGRRKSMSGINGKSLLNKMAMNHNSNSSSKTPKSSNNNVNNTRRGGLHRQHSSAWRGRNTIILQSDDDEEDAYVEEQDELIIRKGCKLISNLTYNDTSGYFTQQFATNGTVGIITKRMKQFRNNEALQEEAFMVLFYISFSDFESNNNENDPAAVANSSGGGATTILNIFNDSVLTILCDTMNGYPKNRNLQGAAMSTLRMIAFKCHDIQTVMIERCQIIEQVLKILKSNWKHPRLVSIGCQLLKLLATNKEEARTRIRKQKGTLLLAQIEDQFRSTTDKDQDAVADLALDVFMIVCKDQDAGFGNTTNATTNANGRHTNNAAPIHTNGHHHHYNH